MLTLRPDLTWRDVKEIISTSCLKNDPNAGGSGIDDTEWFNNKANRPYNLQYGFGLVDYGNIITNTKSHILLPEQTGFRIDLFEDIDLSQPQEISFVINEDTNTRQINDDIPLTLDYDTFIIQEFLIVFESLEDGSDRNDEVHELNISLSVEDRYRDDYNEQPIVIGRKIRFEVISLENYPILSEFLKGEKLVGNDGSSNWKLLLSDVDTRTPLFGKLSHIEFIGYNN
jgi:hypothetical protein